MRGVCFRSYSYTMCHYGAWYSHTFPPYLFQYSVYPIFLRLDFQTISHQSLKEGFKNYLFTTLPVLHQPHGSRPWKQLKYKNPLKYYWLKYTKGLDKI